MRAKTLQSSKLSYFFRISAKLLSIPVLMLTAPLFAAGISPPVSEYQKLMVIEGNTGNTLVMPTDVAIGKQQQIYIVDSGNHRVQVFSPDGAYKFSFGSKGSGRDQLNSPVGITTARDGRVLVADRGNNRIQIYDENGVFLLSIPTIAGKTTLTPVDVAVDSSEKKIIVSASGPHHRLMVFNNKGKLIGFWGKPGNNQGEFRYPASVTVSRSNETYIVDVFNTRVQVFDSKGEFLVSVGSWGVTPGHLFRPKGVTIENDKQILVSDSYLGVIQIFNSDTRFHAVLGANGEIARFDTPAGMAVDKHDRLYVAEIMANRVSVLKPVRKQ